MKNYSVIGKNYKYGIATESTLVTDSIVEAFGTFDNFKMCGAFAMVVLVDNRTGEIIADGFEEE